MGRELERVELLLGKENVAKLKQSTAAVAGVGGVGSFAAEALARTGIGHLILIDKDVVSESNLNRQIMAVRDTVGVNKCLAMKERIESYRTDCRVDCLDMFLEESNMDVLLGADIVIDAIDTVTSKLALISYCHEHDIPVISSLGMGNRLDPSQVYICDLWETSGDPLARSVRQMARKRGMNYPITVMMSKEVPAKQNQVTDPDGQTRKDRIPPASVIFVPAEAGLLAASYAVRKILGVIGQ